MGSAPLLQVLQAISEVRGHATLVKKNALSSRVGSLCPVGALYNPIQHERLAQSGQLQTEFEHKSEEGMASELER